MVLYPRGLGKGAAVDVGNWVLGQSLLPHPLWGTEAAPQKAALASARWQCKNEAQRRLVWALKSQGLVKGGAEDTSREGP